MQFNGGGRRSAVVLLWYTLTSGLSATVCALRFCLDLPLLLAARPRLGFFFGIRSARKSRLEEGWSAEGSTRTSPTRPRKPAAPHASTDDHYVQRTAATCRWPNRAFTCPQTRRGCLSAVRAHAHDDSQRCF
jgi:hypothetical protein